MAFRFSTKLLADFLSTMKTDLGNGVIQLYSGSQPSSPDSAVSGTLIGTATLNDAGWTDGTTTNGLIFSTPTLVAGAPYVDVASGAVWKFHCVNAGTIGWGRFIGNSATSGLTNDTTGSADGSFVHPRVDFSVGITTGDAQMSKVTYAVGETGIIQSFNVPFSNIS